MLKTLSIAFLAVLAAPLALAADDDARPRMQIPEAAFKACEGKQAGDTATLNGPDGKSFTGSCREVKGKLAVMPEHGGKGGHEGEGHPSGEGRMGPPPEAFKACEGKSAGDTASFSNAEGKSMSGTCRELKGKLAVMPERKPKD